MNIKFDYVRVQVLGKEELPSLNETISMIKAKKCRRWIMVDPLIEHGSIISEKIISRKKLVFNHNQL